MNEIKKIIDFSAWTGNWPFMHYSLKELDTLKERLKSINTVKAFVAPIEGILERDPMRANRQLLENIQDDFFSPVLIADLSYRNWEQVVELAVKDGRVKMLKLLPNYHMYTLSEENLGKLVELTVKNKLLISIQFKVEDTRGQYPLMKIPDVDVLHTVRIISYFPEQTFIFNNLYMGEVAQALHSTGNVYVDIASLESQNILRKLNSAYSLDKFLFSSHCPFYYPEGSLFKLKYSDVEMAELEKVAFKNAEGLIKNLE